MAKTTKTTTARKPRKRRKRQKRANGDVAEVLQPTEEQAFCLEIPLSDKDILAWSLEQNPEQMVHVATAGKRARAEVQIHKLSPEEQKLFAEAKDRELPWLQTNAIRPILRQTLNFQNRFQDLGLGRK